MNDLGNEYDEDHSRQHGEIKYIQALLRIIVILMFGAGMESTYACSSSLALEWLQYHESRCASLKRGGVSRITLEIICVYLSQSPKI